MTPSLTTDPTNSTGLSTIIAGAWRMANWTGGLAQHHAWVDSCLQQGVTSFDHADVYGHYQTHALFGQVLRERPELRDQMQLVSKCGIALVTPQRPGHWIKHYNTSAAHIRASVEQTLTDLHTDRLDLLLIHRPDPLMDADEVATCFEALQREGKVLKLGVSNHSPSQFDLLHSRIALTTNQIELSPLHLAPLYDGTLDQAQRLRLRPMIWSPMAGGRLWTEASEASARVRDALTRVASLHGTSPATAAYAWLLRHPSRPHIIVGSQHSERLAQAAAAQQIQLDPQAWTAILSASVGRDVP